MQSSLFDQVHHTAEQIDLALPDATITYIPQWLSAQEAERCYQSLVSEITWSQDTIKLYGKTHLIPRLQAWVGDKQASYQYSGIQLTPLPWTPTLTLLKQKCEQTCATEFNSVLANWYQHGQHSMGMHSDDEPELGAMPTIASVSLGAERTLTFKHKRNGEQHRLQLAHGSLLIMAGSTQRYWQHGINKTARPTQGRINLTYRWIHNASTTTDHR
ncbi:alpha-ketoglutarate-dependent dioxygenase AlkB family protein [Alteromonas flava]|uniref:alpha-ketoglutarate-dependent dioxygenase AlkB family protein n=1 Tax=Alteromonas flava TaxID=2048003 RepID=UPI000C28E3CD|nr:alpha-ketoglutarate-dependent dioxygenase AlkB [Alteromonas flava]